MGILQKGMQAFAKSDDAVLAAMFKFVRELLDNRMHRVHFEPTSMSGFLLFKDSTKLLCDFYNYFDMLKNKPVRHARSPGRNAFNVDRVGNRPRKAGPIHREVPAREHDTADLLQPHPGQVRELLGL